MRATTSLPTPLSPLMNTGTSTGAICRICWRIFSICGLAARNERSSVSASQYSRSAWFSERNSCFCRHLQKRRIQFRLFERLGEVVERAQADRFHHRGHFVRARKHDHVQRAVHLHQLPQRLEPVHFRHQHVQNHEVRPLALADLAPALPCRWTPSPLRSRPLPAASADTSECSVRRPLPESFLFQPSIFPCRCRICPSALLDIRLATRTKTCCLCPTSLSTQIFPRCA